MESERCLFLRQCEGARGYPFLGYCLANREGGLRAVTIAEFRDYCIGPGYRRCQTYRVRSAQKAGEAA